MTFPGALAAALALILACAAPSAAAEPSLPHFVHKEGRHALFVDGAPYLILGAQVHNSSAWPEFLAKVWPAIDFLEANTLEVPVYWEQFEPEEGKFDYTVVDTLLTQARDHEVRLVLLWFGTWKNGSAHYMPLWAKRQPARFPRVTGKDGRIVDSPSPFGEYTLAADKRAFTGLMRHLKLADPRHTVIMVQVENEAGTYGSVRDYSPAAQSAFESAVPVEILKAMHKTAAANATWTQAFGPDADEFFHAWAVARYVGQIAAAGKGEYPLPLYTNAAIRDPFHHGPPGSSESGAPTDNVIPIWKAMAPALDLLTPNLYMSDPPRYQKVLELYSGPENPLFVPETGNTPAFAPLFFAALGRGAIGCAPFGTDYTGASNAPLGALHVDEEALAPFALNYRLAGPIMRELARLSFEGKLQAVAEERDAHVQTLTLGRWNAVISFGVPPFLPAGNPGGNKEPVGRALVAQLGDDEFLVSGLSCRVDFQVSEQASGWKREYLRVEEGSYTNGTFRRSRIWNGDQTDWGLNFSSEPVVLRIKLGTY